VTFDEEVWPRLHFAQNPLKVVVAQVRFPTSHALGDAAVHAVIQLAVAEHFPKPLAAMQEVAFAVTPQGPTAPQVQQTAVRFSDDQEKSIMAIGPGLASYETTDYRGWEDFEPQLERVLGLVTQHGSPTQSVRFGLRYVDEILLEGVTRINDWAEILTDRVLGTADSLGRDPRVVETTQGSSIRVGDDVVNVRHGYVRRPSDDGGETSVYVLDADIFTDLPRPWDVAALLDDANRYRLWMRTIFGRSLTPVGIERMGGAVE
jgi:uncharacterized protein (TIGR04255 family)